MVEKEISRAKEYVFEVSGSSLGGSPSFGVWSRLMGFSMMNVHSKDLGAIASWPAERTNSTHERHWMIRETGWGGRSAASTGGSWSCRSGGPNWGMLTWSSLEDDKPEHPVGAVWAQVVVVWGLAMIGRRRLTEELGVVVLWGLPETGFIISELYSDNEGGIVYPLILCLILAPTVFRCHCHLNTTTGDFDQVAPSTGLLFVFPLQSPWDPVFVVGKTDLISGPHMPHFTHQPGPAASTWLSISVI